MHGYYTSLIYNKNTSYAEKFEGNHVLNKNCAQKLKYKIYFIKIVRIPRTVARPESSITIPKLPTTKSELSFAA